MTQFAGYVLSGSVFIAFGLKWSLDATIEGPINDYAVDDTRSFSNRSRSSTRKRRTRCSCKLKNWPLEGFVKILVSLIGAAISLHTAYANGELKYVSAIVVATTYLFFALSGLVDVLTFYCPLVMPFGLEKFALALAFAIEGIIFSTQLSQESFMEQKVHFFIICAVLACGFSTLVEIVMPWSRIVRFARAYFTLLNGSLFIQCGFTLYHPSQSSLTWSTTDEYHTALSWITVIFAWHCAGALVVLLILMALSRKRVPIKPPPMEPDFEAEVSVHSIPRCHFSSLSNCGDLKP